MGWFEVADGRLRCARPLTHEPVRDWLASGDGASAVEAAARQISFAFLGRKRAARRQLRRTLHKALALPCVQETVAAECDRYLDAWAPLAYAPALPRLTIALRRVVVVPRAMIVWRITSRAAARLHECLRAADAPESFRAFFSRWVVARMDEAIRLAGPCPQRPLYAHESWACVALDSEFTWVDPLNSGPEGRGHVVLFEMPAPRLPRRERRELETRLGELTGSLPSLTRQQRDYMVRAAMDQTAPGRL